MVESVGNFDVLRCLCVEVHFREGACGHVGILLSAGFCRVVDVGCIILL